MIVIESLRYEGLARRIAKRLFLRRGRRRSPAIVNVSYSGALVWVIGNRVSIAGGPFRELDSTGPSPSSAMPADPPGPPEERP